jgi:CDP-glucose 4,6-dehydratase
MENLELNKILRDQRVLVTGASGLVGSKLVQRLIDMEAKVAILLIEESPESLLVRNRLLEKCTVYSGSLADYSFVERSVCDFEPEIVFHLGAQTIVGKAIQNPKVTFEANIQGTWNLLEAIRLNVPEIQSIAVASSDKAYGTSKVLPYDESFPLHGDGPYDVSKSCTDLISQSYGTTYSLPVVIARCGNIYGPGDFNWSRIVPGTLRALFKDEMPIIRSNGSNLRDYIFVDDVVNAYLNLAVNRLSWQPGEAFNFSNDKAYSVMEIYTVICDVVKGKYVEPKIMNLAINEIQDQHLTSEKANKILNWESQYSLKEGLQLTAPWYKEILRMESN